SLLPQALRAWTARARLMRSAPPDPVNLITNAPLFESLRPKLTPQDRIAIVFIPKHFTLMPKTAELLSVPAVRDYEPAPTERSAESAVMMRTATPLRNLDSFYYFGGLASPIPGPLLNLTAGRYVFAETRAPELPKITARLHPIGGAAGVG